MAYEYKMVQIPPTIQVSSKEYKGNEAAVYLESKVNEMAAQGWEYYRVDSFGVDVKPGCLAALSGQKASSQIYYVITFRKTK